MRLIRNKKAFIIGVFCIAVSLFFFGIYIWSGDFSELFYVLLQSLAGLTCIINSISSGFLGEKQPEISEDERDNYISSKCCKIASRVMFYCVIVIILVFGIMHLTYEKTVFGVVAVSLLSCLLLYTVAYFVANIYYEKKG